MLKKSVKDKLEQLKLKGFLRSADSSLDQMISQGALLKNVDSNL